MRDDIHVSPPMIAAGMAVFYDKGHGRLNGTVLIDVYRAMVQAMVAEVAIEEANKSLAASYLQTLGIDDAPAPPECDYGGTGLKGDVEKGWLVMRRSDWTDG